MEIEREALKILGKKWSKTSRLVASSKVLRSAIPTQNCDIIMTLPATTNDSTLMWLLARLRMRTPELHVHVRHWKSTGVYAFYMTAHFDYLLKGAEEFGILKSLKSEFGSGHREFLYEEQSCFEGIEDEEHFFTSQERQCIVYNMLLNLRALSGETLGKLKFLEGQSVVPLLESNKIVSQVFPLHDTTGLRDLRKSWVTSLARKQPLDDVCEYFGVKIAMYFAYLGHYTSALIVPMVLGIVFWCIQDDSQVIEDLCFVTFALFNVFWATVYMELWLRRNSELAYKWGTLDKKGELLQEPRPLYTGYCTTNLITGRVEPVYPSWKRHLFRYCVSLPVIGLCLVLVFYIMLLIFTLQEWINSLVKEEHIPSMCSYLPKILLAVTIWVMDEIYKKIATWLNDKENYRMEETYENHLIIKLVLFQFVNSFLSLFYIAFYLQDMDRLRDQLATLMITRQVIGNIREAVVPYLLWKAKLMKVGYDITGHMSPHTLEKEIKDLANDTPCTTTKEPMSLGPTSPLSEVNPDDTPKVPKEVNHDDRPKVPKEVNPDNTPKVPKDPSKESIEDKKEFRRHSLLHGNISPLTLTQAEVESTMKKYEDTFDDHLEMFIQYGYVILFSSAFPLAALCAFLNNIIEIRSDAFKLCCHQQRPFGKRVENIGTWLDALRVMGVIAVIVNSALIGVSGQVNRMYPDLDTKSTFILIVSLEHVILALKTCIAYAIPSRPEWIDTEMARLEFRRREAVKSMNGTPLDMKTHPFRSPSTTPSPTKEYNTPKVPEIPVRKNTSNLDSLISHRDAREKQTPNPFFDPSHQKVKGEIPHVEGHEKLDKGHEIKLKGRVKFKDTMELSETMSDPSKDSSKDNSPNCSTLIGQSVNSELKSSLTQTGILRHRVLTESTTAPGKPVSEAECSGTPGTRPPDVDHWYCRTSSDCQARLETKRKILQAAKQRHWLGERLSPSRSTDL